MNRCVTGWARPAVGIVVGPLASFGLERLVLDSWPWWAHFTVAGAGGTVPYLTTPEQLQRLRGFRMRRKLLGRRGERTWISHDDAVALVWESPVVRNLAEYRTGADVMAHLITGTPMRDRTRDAATRSLLANFHEEYPKSVQDDKYCEEDLREWVDRKTLQDAKERSHVTQRATRLISEPKALSSHTPQPVVDRLLRSAAASKPKHWTESELDRMRREAGG